MRTVFTSQSPDETRHHGEDVHNYLTSLDYGYGDIRSILVVAQTDPREQWFRVMRDDEDGDHAVRYVRKTNRWEVAETPAGE